MNKKGLILGFLGLMGFSAFFVGQRFEEVWSLLQEAGWLLFAISLWHLVPLFFDVLAWKSVLPKDSTVPLSTLYRVRWTGEGINALLPVLSLGGELYKLLSLTSRGVAMAKAAASIVVDLTLALLSEILFVACGIALVFEMKANANLPEGLATGLLIAITIAVLVFVLQRGKTFELLARLLARFGLGEEWIQRLGDLRELDGAIHALHKNPGALLRCFVARLAGWTFGTLEVWLGLRVLGHPLSLAEAFVLESLCQAVRTAGFAIPGALGVQEGGYVLIGRGFGLDDSTSLALSLARRVRDLTLGVPALVLLQIQSGKRAFGSGDPGTV